MDRYSRQVILPAIGPDGQRRLMASRVTLIGCGALGTVLAETLTRTGVGNLRIVDRDYVELSNLQRQVLFDEDDARDGVPKAVAAASKLRRINSDVELQAVVEDFAAENAERLLADADIALDGTDNFEARYLLNDVCVKLQRPWVYAAAIATSGLTMPIIPGETACLRCVFPRPAPSGQVDTCDTAGVLGSLPGVLANLAATEAIKLLVGAQDQLSRGLLWVDVWQNSVERTPLAEPVPDCPSCQHHQFEFLEAAAGTRAETLCGRDAVQVRPPRGNGMELGRLAERLSAIGEIQQNAHLVRLLVNGYQLTVFRDGRAIVKGTSDPHIARSLYSRYVGT